MKQLYPCQEAAKKHLMSVITKHGAALNGSETGTGKTLVAASIAAEVDNPVLVLAPKAVLPMWRTELAERGVTPLAVVNYEMLRRGKLPWGKWTRGQFEWTIPDNTFVITDECQKTKSPGSQNSKMLLAAKPFFNLCLSATAAENPTEMRALGYILDLHKLSNWYPWCRNQGAYQDRWGNLAWDGSPTVLAALHHQIYPAHGHRLRIADLKEHFTETSIITTPLDFGPRIAQIYQEMEKELAALAETMTSDSCHPAAAALVATLRARQSVELCKVGYMLELIEDLVAEGRSVALFVNFDATIEALRERCGLTCALVRGGQSTKERQDMIDLFQSNRVSVVLCNIQAGGLGISLHDLHGDHPRTAIISPSWSAFDVIQALGRVHRAGGQSDTQQHILFAAGTIEEKVEQVVRQKITNIGIINDGKRVDA